MLSMFGPRNDYKWNPWMLWGHVSFQDNTSPVRCLLTTCTRTFVTKVVLGRVRSTLTSFCLSSCGAGLSGNLQKASVPSPLKRGPDIHVALGSSSLFTESRAELKLNLWIRAFSAREQGKGIHAQAPAIITTHHSQHRNLKNFYQFGGTGF